MENLFVETVFTSEINGIEYQIYSQAVPPEATNYDEVVFYLFFLIEKDDSYASDYMNDIGFAFNLTLVLIVTIILTGFSIVLAIILFIALRTAGRITHAIDVMTEYSERLKMAMNVQGKNNIIA